MTIIELKASCYDCIAQIEYFQAKLKELNEQIAKQMQEDGNGEVIS